MYKKIKRTFDIFFSGLGLIFLSPLFISIIILLKLTGEREIFFKQERLGYKKKVFKILKFATMLKNSPNIGSRTITLRNDPRITTIGRYLRISKINELPQLINVLAGEMSLVGPRPLLMSGFVKYSTDIQEILYQNPPGITGIGSLVFRDEEKLVSAYAALGLNPMSYYNQYIYRYKGALESWYYNNCSFLTDLKILFITFWSIIFPESDIVYKIFGSLPPKPTELNISWINKIKAI